MPHAKCKFSLFRRTHSSSGPRLHIFKISDYHWIFFCKKIKKTFCQIGIRNIWSFAMRKPVFGGLRPGKTQTRLLSYNDPLRSPLDLASIGIIQTRQRTTKTLIRLHRLICVFVVRTFILLSSMKQISTDTRQNNLKLSNQQNDSKEDNFASAGAKITMKCKVHILLA